MRVGFAMALMVMVWGGIEGIDDLRPVAPAARPAPGRRTAPAARPGPLATLHGGALALAIAGGVVAGATAGPDRPELDDVAVPTIVVGQGAATEHLEVKPAVALSGIVHSRSGPWERWNEAVRHCESREDPLAVNRESGAGGLYQVTPETWDGFEGYALAQLAPPDVQERFAADLYRRRGLQPWLASKPCWRPIVEDGAAYPA